jgi:hypothetical protein
MVIMCTPVVRFGKAEDEPHALFEKVLKLQILINTMLVDTIFTAAAPNYKRHHGPMLKKIIYYFRTRCLI